MSVRMVHPALPGQEIAVPEASVFGHRAMGWITAEEAAAAPEAPEPAKPAAVARRTSPSGKE